MRTRVFTLRNTKEMLRDKINLIFGIGFPVILLLLLTLINNNIPVDMFNIRQLTPGIAVFGLSFISLFSGMLISKDRTSSFLMRLFTSPMTSAEFIAGYTLPLLPMGMAQICVCFVVAAVLGLELSLNILLAIAVCIPAVLFFIGIGLICGSVFNDKQVGGLCGALLTNLTGWLSGTWFDTESAGNVFDAIARALPFVHAVDAARYALTGEYSLIMPELIWVIGYAVVSLTAAALIFSKKMKAE